MSTSYWARLDRLAPPYDTEIRLGREDPHTPGSMLVLCTAFNQCYPPDMNLSALEPDGSADRREVERYGPVPKDATHWQFLDGQLPSDAKMRQITAEEEMLQQAQADILRKILEG